MLFRSLVETKAGDDSRHRDWVADVQLAAIALLMLVSFTRHRVGGVDPRH